MEKKDKKTELEVDRLELAEQRLRVATQLVRFTKEVTTLCAVSALIAL